MKFLFCFLSFLIGSGSVLAGVIKGKVTDAKGTSLPYATVYVKGTTIGVSSNSSGEYKLSVPDGTYQVYCQYIGFTQEHFNVTVSGDKEIMHDFILTDEGLKIEEVVIKMSREDPAYRIIRNAIKQRKYHLRQIESFQTSIYFKGVMRSRDMPEKVLGQKVNTAELGVDSLGKGVLYLTEEEADYYTNGRQEKTVIHAVHESGDKSGLGFSRFPHVITFYKNNVNMLGSSSRGFISPISENALNFYNYKLLGTFDEQGKTIYKIRVFQKRKYEACFNGIIYIADSSWAIHSLDLNLTKMSGLDFVDTLKVEQVYIPLSEDNWVIKSQVLYFAVNIMMFDITATGVAVYNNQQANTFIDDAVFAGKIKSQYDKTANKIDSGHWENRPIPLKEDEVVDFRVKDSLNEIRSTPQYIDSIRRRNNRFKPMAWLVGEPVYSGKEYKNIYRFNALALGLFRESVINYNIIEGFDLAPKANWLHKIDSSTNLNVDGALRYGFSNRHFNAITRVSYTTHDRAWRNRAWTYGVEGGKYVFQYNPANPVMPFLNTYRCLLVRENDLKIYERWEAAGFVKRNYGNGLSWFIKADWQRRLPLTNTTTFSIIPGSTGGFADNAPPPLKAVAAEWEPHNAMLVNASVSYRPGITYTQYPDYKVANRSRWPLFRATFQKAIPGILDGKADFEKWQFSVRGVTRFGFLGNMKYNILTGGFLKTAYVSFPDLKHIRGMRGIGYSAPYLESFQFAPYYQFSNKDHFFTEAHLEYHMNGLLSNKIPVMKQAGFHLLFGANVFYSAANNNYTETFIGVDNIGWKMVRFLRIDFVQSWDSHGGSNSGIRFGFNLSSASNSKYSPIESEW